MRLHTRLGMVLRLAELLLIAVAFAWAMRWVAEALGALGESAALLLATTLYVRLSLRSFPLRELRVGEVTLVGEPRGRSPGQWPIRGRIHQSPESLSFGLGNALPYSNTPLTAVARLVELFAREGESDAGDRSGLVLRDAHGRARIVLSVSDKKGPVIALLDTSGGVVWNASAPP